MSRIKKYVKPLVLLGLILIVFVTGCGDMYGGGGCSGTQAQGWSGFTAYNKVLCFGSMEGKVIALDPVARSDNKTFPSDSEWAYVIKTAAPGATCGAMCSPSSSTTGMGIYGTPVVVGDLVYVGTYTGKIYAINANRGVVRWLYPREGYETVGAIVGNIVTDGQTLYFGSANGKIYALDAITGDFKWEFLTSNKIWTAPAIDKGVIYAGNYGGNVYAISAETGKEIWSIKIPSAVASPVVIYDNTLYFGTFDRYMYALDKANGQERWKFAAGNWFWAAPVIKDGKIYAACLDRKLYMIDAGTGKELWQFTAESPLVSVPAISGKNLYTISDKGTLYKLDMESGAMVGSVPLGFIVYGSLYADGDMVYVYARDHNVYAVDMAKSIVTWKFSSFLK